MLSISAINKMLWSSMNSNESQTVCMTSPTCTKANLCTTSMVQCLQFWHMGRSKILSSIICVTIHLWLADLAPPVGSQEVVDHTHKWWQLIGQHLPVCTAGWVPKTVQVGSPVGSIKRNCYRLHGLSIFRAGNDLYYLSYNIQLSSHATLPL